MSERELPVFGSNSWRRNSACGQFCVDALCNLHLADNTAVSMSKMSAARDPYEMTMLTYYYFAIASVLGKSGS